MKIRILANTLRIRLTRSEVSRLVKEGQVTETTSFPTIPLIYAVRQYEGHALTVDYADHQITLNIPISMAEALHNTQQVGFEDNTGPVSILIEKDFVCLDNPREDQHDQYPNPNQRC